MKINLVVIRRNFPQGKEFFNGYMTFCLKDILSKRHFVEYDISSKFRRKVSKFV